jgi:8-oxo-dGTP pyrophosphatase MutT (NUDIX family)
VLSWPAIAAATLQREPRVPFFVGGVEAGSVARAQLGALPLRPDVLRVGHDRVELVAPPPQRDAALAELNCALRTQGLVRGWRDELYAIVDPLRGTVLARTERAASRFWGTLTFGAHANGWVAGADGRPEWLWVATRSAGKATDPGRRDNLVGGGVPFGQTPAETLVREAWEEAGLTPAQVQPARPGRIVRMRRDIPEGVQHEWLYVYDLELSAGVTPVNQDGEVAAFDRLPVADALALAAGSTMTVDAALVTLDFALRHQLLGVAETERLGAQSAGLWM